MSTEQQDARPFVTAVLHVGFLSIAETPEMLERLRRPEPDEPDSTARSRLFSELQRIGVTPIDATAGVVGGSK
jgi:hypothetical protein